MTGTSDEVVRTVQAYYTERLRAGSCCGPNPASAAADEEAIPSFGCGDPSAIAGLRAGERVLDLGSGAGLDVFRAAEAVGPAGRVVGVDMTPAMLERARSGARRLALEERVEFREGRIEALPLDDATIDVVLSNCVINLSTDKGAVFREIARVLVPGGRMVVGDELVHGRHLHAPSPDGWCGCVDGAVAAGSYVELARAAGLVDVRVEPQAPPVPFGGTYSATIRARRPDVRPADAELSRAATVLLEGADLPTAGWLGDATQRWVLVEDGVLAGAVALELHGGEALVRSLVVAPAVRGRGLARALLAVALAAAERAGASRVHALTTTIPELLVRWGFSEVARDALPSALSASAELSGACPEGARAFVIPLLYASADRPTGA